MHFMETFYMAVSKNSGFSPKIIHFNRGFISIIFTIHFGVFPYFRKHPYLGNVLQIQKSILKAVEGKNGTPVPRSWDP